MAKKTLTKKELDKIKKIVSGILGLDAESHFIIKECLKNAVKFNSDYHRFNLRFLLGSVDSLATISNMEKHLSRDINEKWKQVDENDAYASLGIMDKPTPKVLIMILLEKIKRKEL